MNTSDFNYKLPDELIAQHPPAERTDSKMMVLSRADQSIRDAGIACLSEYLRDGDLLVFNNTKVFPARTRGVRADTGGKVELVFVRQLGEESLSPGGECASKWLCIFGSGSKTRAGQSLSLCDGSIKAEISAVLDQGHVEVEVVSHGSILDVLERQGEIPLPPYIGRSADDAAGQEVDRARYQTVYASERGAVAAPTAGLHFTDELFRSLAQKGIGRCEITLHVGPGTFLPVKVDDVESHVMHSEHYTVTRESADTIRRTKDAGGRVIAVGTTTARTLEGLHRDRGGIEPASAETDIFIYPSFEFRVIDGLLTNFHLPKSTLLMMVSAFAGTDFVRKAYADAVSKRYRFYSYGDCMLIL